MATTYDGTQLRIYINGVQVGSRAVTGSIVPASGVLRFGGNAVWGEYFIGLIDEIRIYDGPRIQAEIQADMDTAVQGFNARADHLGRDGPGDGRGHGDSGARRHGR